MRYDPLKGEIVMSASSRVTLKDGRRMDEAAFIETFRNVAALQPETQRILRDYVAGSGEKPEKGASRAEKERGAEVLTGKQRSFLKSRGVMDENSTLYHVTEIFVREMAARGLDSGSSLQPADLLARGEYLPPSRRALSKS